MPLLEADRSVLLLIDFQARLMPAIDQAESTIRNARRLLDAAAILGVPKIFTEQNAAKLGATVAELAPGSAPIIHKMSFDASSGTDLLTRLPPDRAIIVAGWESHVCVLQTVLGLRAEGRSVSVVADAIGSRRAESKSVAIDRMVRHGADAVTTEMVLFEWLRSADHPRFRDLSALIK